MSTYAQLKVRVSKRLGLDATAGEDDDTQVGSYLNDAVLDFLLETHCKVALAESVALTAGEGDYELDSDILATHKILSSDGVPLERVGETDIYDLRRGQANATSSMFYAVSGANMLMLWPTPDTASTLTIYYVPRPTAMSADSNDPATSTYGGVPAEYHKALEAYACWQAADYDDDVSSGQGQKYQGEYYGWIARFKKAVINKGGRGLPRAHLARRGHRRSSSNSADYGPF